MVIQYILRYLIAHPDAKDTVQGILQWWLPAHDLRRGEEEVQEALDTLVAQGWLTQRKITPARTLYGLDQEKLEEIQRFLDSRD